MERGKREEEDSSETWRKEIENAAETGLPAGIGRKEGEYGYGA